MLARICLTAAAILLLIGAPAASADPVPEYFNVPAGYGAGAGIAPAPDGTVWFASNLTASPRPSVGRLVVAQASPGTANGMATFPTPTQPGAGCCANGVTSVAFDAANKRLWFVQNDGIVGYADVASVSPGTSAGMTDMLLAHPVSLADVAIGANGLAWFSEHGASNVPPYAGNRIASIDALLNVTELSNIALQGGASVLDPLRYDAKPNGITTDPSGRPWFAEAEPGNPGYRIATPRGVDYDEYLVQPCAGSPCSGSFTGTGITDVAVAQDGSIWFTNQLRNEVGRLDLVNRTFTNYSLPGIDPGLAGGQARAISVAPDGTLWIAENGGFSFANANAIVRIVPSQPTPTATVWHLGAGKFPGAVAAGTQGDVWFTVGTNAEPALIGRLAGVIAGGGGSGGTGGGGTGGSGTGGGTGGSGTPLRPVSVGVARVGSPSIDGTRLTVNQVCVGPPSDPCSLVYLISTREYVTGFPGSRASAARKRRAKPKPLILGRKTVTLHGGERRRVTIELNATGRRLLRRAGRLTVFFTVTQKGADGKPPRRIKATKLTFRVRARHRR